jgi:hypothetical protein
MKDILKDHKDIIEGTATDIVEESLELPKKTETIN